MILSRAAANPTASMQTLQIVSTTTSVSLTALTTTCATNTWLSMMKHSTVTTWTELNVATDHSVMKAETIVSSVSSFEQWAGCAWRKDMNWIRVLFHLRSYHNYQWAIARVWHDLPWRWLLRVWDMQSLLLPLFCWAPIPRGNWSVHYSNIIIWKIVLHFISIDVWGWTGVQSRTGWLRLGL